MRTRLHAWCHRAREWLNHRRAPAPEVTAARETRAEVSSLVVAARREADAIMAVIDRPKAKGHHG